MKHNLTRILLVEAGDFDARLVLEAVAEIREGACRPVWTCPVEATHAASLDEASLLLASGAFDAILLDLDPPGEGGIESYLRLREAAGDLPVVVLTDAANADLARSAVREGAQDYLLKSEIDCLPLARCLRHAFEKQRLSAALRRSSLVDGFTGVYSLNGFFTLAGHDLELARRLNIDYSLLLTEAESGQDRNLSLLAMADLLRSAMPETAVIGRLAGDRFAAAAAGLPACRLPALPVRRGVADLRAAPSAGIDELLSIAEKALCENEAGGARSRPSVLTQPTA